MKKKDVWILSIILAIPLIAGIVLAWVFNFDLEKGEWITLITSCISTFAAIFLGYMVFFQAENHKRRQEEDNVLYQEQAEKNRQQELLIKANPVAYLKGLKRVEFSTVGCSSTLHCARNDLTDEEPILKITHFNNYFSFDILFDNTFGKMVDFITIKDATLCCDYGAFAEENYKRNFEYRFTNYSQEKAIIKIGQPGECIALLQLYTNKFKNDDSVKILDLLKNSELNWILRFNYTISNSCGVCANFESQIIFRINSITQHAFGVSTEYHIQDVVTWQRGGIEIIDIKENN